LPCRAYAVPLPCRAALFHTYPATPMPVQCCCPAMPCRVNSHSMPRLYRSHGVPLPCRAASIHTCHSVPLPFSDTAVSFVKVRVVAVNILTASPYSSTDWYASDNNLRGTPRGSRKKPNEGKSPTCRLWTADAISHMQCHVHAALCRSLEKSLSERHRRGIAWARHGMVTA
jgi:hypothetical protein